MTQLTYDCVFDAIADTPEEAADLRFRSGMMTALIDLIQARGLKQTEVAKILNVPQPRVSELMTGKIDLISSDRLIGYLARFGLRLNPSFSDGEFAVTVDQAA